MSSEKKEIRALGECDLDTVMQIWLDTNIHTHDFIPREYWTGKYAMVKNMLPQAEVYVFKNKDTRQIGGFIGLTDDYIAGIFIKKSEQSKGLGKRLLDYVKERKTSLCLNVYQKNVRAVRFYQREQFTVQSESIDEETKEKEYRMIWNAE